MSVEPPPRPHGPHGGPTSSAFGRLPKLGGCQPTATDKEASRMTEHQQDADSPAADALLPSGQSSSSRQRRGRGRGTLAPAPRSTRPFLFRWFDHLPL